MDIVNKENVKSIDDACGQLKELYNSENLSLSYAIITDDAKSHKHIKLEEVYYIIKGKAQIQIENEIFEIKAGDTFGIPKNKYHNIKNVEEPIELIVVTNPKFDIGDLIY